MAKKSRQEPIPEFTDVHVRLKPILGLRPGLYLTVIYGLALLAILFFLLLYPGLRRRGTYYSIETFPAGAVVRVDGRYLGSTPGEFLVPAGDRRIEIAKPYYQTVVMSEQVGGRVFGTLFFPPRRRVQTPLEIEDVDGLLEYSLNDFAATPYIPEILIETAKGSISRPEARQKMSDFVDNSKYFIQSVYQLGGLAQALLLVESGGRAPTPASYIASVQKFAHLVERYENTPYWLLVSLTPEKSRLLVDSQWFAAYHRDFLQSLAGGFREGGPSGASPAGPSATVGGISFLGIPGGDLVMGRDDDLSFWQERIDLLLPHSVRVPGFSMAATEVSNRQYRMFLEANPSWKKSNLDELISRGLADENYLAHWDGDSFAAELAELPVVNVPWAAAEAFCAWLTRQLGDRFPGYRARLPFEAEWEWAARGGLAGQPYPSGRGTGNARLAGAGTSGASAVGTSEPNGYGLRDMIGNVWEWCADWYSPVSYFFTSRRPEENAFDTRQLIPQGAERSVRGGSWANERELVRVYTRGSQPPAWGTPYLGFRPVLSRN